MRRVCILGALVCEILLVHKIVCRENRLVHAIRGFTIYGVRSIESPGATFPSSNDDDDDDDDVVGARG